MEGGRRSSVLAVTLVSQGLCVTKIARYGWWRAYVVLSLGFGDGLFQVC